MRVDTAWKEALRRGYPEYFTEPQPKATSRDWLVVANTPRSITVQDIVRAVSDYTGVSASKINSHRRPAGVCFARHVSMYLAKDITGLSLKKIGKAMGGRDHTTVLSGVRKIESRLETDTSLAAELNAIRAKLEEGAAG